MSNINEIFPPRRDDPVDRCHILFNQLHSLLTILSMLSAEPDNALGWGRDENNLFCLLLGMVEELADNYSRHLDDMAAEVRGHE